MIKSLFLSSLFVFPAFAEQQDFSSVKELLKKDELEKQAEKKEAKAKLQKKMQEMERRERYKVPGDRDFWTFFSEYWLIKNAQELSWDFEKPDYGLESAFRTLLETVGYYEKSFKILLLNTPNVAHFALPAGNNKYLFLVSVPFIRTLNLSKIEISLLLLENLLRSEREYVKQALLKSGLEKGMNKNFYGEKLEMKPYIAGWAALSDIAFKKGFSFAQQYEITSQMKRLLKSKPGLLSYYTQMLKKIKKLVESNEEYSQYSKVYPSPQLQLNWLNPKERRGF